MKMLMKAVEASTCIQKYYPANDNEEEIYPWGPRSDQRKEHQEIE